MRSSLRPLVVLSAVLLVAAPTLAADGDMPIRSEGCSTRLYLPPMPGTPQDDAQRIALVPAITRTFRIRYGATYGSMTTYVPSSAGTSVTADTRHEFMLSSLTADTTYYWRVQCLEDGRWKDGWDGQFTTTPTTGGQVRLLVGTDGHMLEAFIGTGGAPPGEYAQRAIDSFALMARHKGIHAYLDDGDTFHFHCRGSCANASDDSDDFGRPFGRYSIAAGATDQAESIAFGAARASWVLRRMWTHLRFMSSIWSRGNHDVGGAYGDNGYGQSGGSRHLQARAEVPWVETGITVHLGDGGDLDTDGIFAEPTHGMSDGDGPYRFAPIDRIDVQSTDFPNLYNCGGARPDGNLPNEWYVDLTGLGDPTNTFRLAYCDTCAGCTSGGPAGYFGSADDWTLVRGSNMQYETKQVTAKYLPNQNTIYPHGWGDPEDGIMGPVPFSDHTVVINLDEYDHSPPAAYRPGFPLSNRSATTGWSLGPNQYTGAIDLIDDLGVAATGWDDVEVAIVLMHHSLGGYMAGPGYPYGRGGLCEPDTYCSDSGEECYEPGECADSGGQCQKQDCEEDFANPEWQALHEALDAFQQRTDGVALVILGHDHFVSGRKKDNVYYYHAGQLGAVMAGWASSANTMARNDFNKDGAPAYYTDYVNNGLGDTYGPAAPNDFPTEWGTEWRGYTMLTIEPASISSSGKTEVKMDYYISSRTQVPLKHGTKAYSFTLLGTQP